MTRPKETMKLFNLLMEPEFLLVVVVGLDVVVVLVVDVVVTVVVVEVAWF